VKQLAWLQAAPTPKETPKSQLGRPKPADKPMTRLQQLEAHRQVPELPPTGPAGHLLAYLFDAGPVGQGAMGAVPLSHSELAAWQANTGIELAAWEAKALRRLSSEYVAASHDAADVACPPFYIDREEADRREAVANRVRNIFGARARASTRH